MKTKLEHAQELAAMGFYVFPLRTNGRLPIVKWRTESTRDVKQIEHWWQVDNDFGWGGDNNIGIDCGKSGYFVLDIDVKNGKGGRESYDALRKEMKLPPTLTGETPSGGRHLIFKNDNFGNTVERLGAGLDSRGVGGFIVAPGSEIDGKFYEFINPNVPIAEMPDALKVKLSLSRIDPSQRNGKIIFEDDGEDNLEWGASFLKQHEPAVDGSGGDKHTFITFCLLKERGISEGMAVELVEEYWNPQCSPPWEPADLRAKAKSAYRSAQNATGVKNALAEFDIFPTDVSIIQPSSTEVGLFSDNQHFDLEDIPHRQWIFGNQALRKAVSVVVAPPGQGKSVLTIQMAISKASGRDLLGIDPGERGRVALFNNEDDMDELRRRTGAVMQHYKIKPYMLYEFDAFGGKQVPYLYLASGEKNPLIIAKRGHLGLKATGADKLVDELIRRKIDWLIVDPFAETHEGNENDNGEQGFVARVYRGIAQKANCGLTLVHHTRKLDGTKSDGHTGNLDSMRGASSFGGVARVVSTFTEMSEKQAKEYGVSKEDRTLYSGLARAKGNMSARESDIRWLKWHGEKINPTLDNPDGESIGILTKANLTKIAAGTLTQRVKALGSILLEICAESSEIDRESVKDEFYSFIDDEPRKPGDELPTTNLKCTAFLRALKTLKEINAIQFDDFKIVILPAFHIHIVTQL